MYYVGCMCTRRFFVRSSRCHNHRRDGSIKSGQILCFLSGVYVCALSAQLQLTRRTKVCAMETIYRLNLIYGFLSSTVPRQSSNENDTFGDDHGCVIRSEQSSGDLQTSLRPLLPPKTTCSSRPSHTTSPPRSVSIQAFHYSFATPCCHDSSRPLRPMARGNRRHITQEVLRRSILILMFIPPTGIVGLTPLSMSPCNWQLTFASRSSRMHGRRQKS